MSSKKVPYMDLSLLDISSYVSNRRLLLLLPLGLLSRSHNSVTYKPNRLKTSTSKAAAPALLVRLFLLEYQENIQTSLCDKSLATSCHTHALDDFYFCCSCRPASLSVPLWVSFGLLILFGTFPSILPLNSCPV